MIRNVLNTPHKVPISRLGKLAVDIGRLLVSQCILCPLAQAGASAPGAAAGAPAAAAAGGAAAPGGGQQDYSAAWAEYYRQQAAYYGQSGQAPGQPAAPQQGQVGTEARAGWYQMEVEILHSSLRSGKEGKMNLIISRS